jgi:hypothetical protein
MTGIGAAAPAAGTLWRHGLSVNHHLGLAPDENQLSLRILSRGPYSSIRAGLLGLRAVFPLGGCRTGLHPQTML